MFQDLQDVIAHVGKESKESITSRLTNKSAHVKEETKDDEVPSSQKWHDSVNLLPSDDLDKLMWGSGGIPPPASPGPSKYSKNWSRRRRHSYERNDSKTVVEEETIEQDEQQQKQQETTHDNNDNIAQALDNISNNSPPSPPPTPDRILLEDIVWKQRSRFGKYSFGILTHDWEQRRVVLFESGKLKYYELHKDMEGIKYDPSNATDSNKSPWVYDPSQEARGEIDLIPKTDTNHEDNDDNDDDNNNNNNMSSSEDLGGEGGRSIAHSSSSFDFGEGMRRLSNLVPASVSVHQQKSTSNKRYGVTVQGRERHDNPGPTPFEIDITRKDSNEMWRFCFQSQSIQVEWLTLLKSMALDGDEDGELAMAVSSDGLDNHGFQPGDHIIRWEMLPVLYPIQIHGIVLEAGKNCCIIADFGLTSYDNQKDSGADKGLTTWSEEDISNDSGHDIIMQAWDKIKPKEKKRLNVIVVTDPKEIRKWSKINYGEQVEGTEESNSTVGFLSSFLPGKSKNVPRKEESKNEDSSAEEESAGDCEDAQSNIDDGCVEKPSINKAKDVVQPTTEVTRSIDVDATKDEINCIEGEPEWIQPGYKPRKRTRSSSSLPVTSDGLSVFSIDKPEGHKQNELPKSDSAKLVLARTHFILEHEDMLPPYHVFYSNSECIAVWCKTGRWSTLQAAVYLVSSSVGFGKSATMLTISVAAAHAILIPALAVGGLAVVGAPLLFLKKSQEKWDEATIVLTERFWECAPHEVFVEAIEYWAKMGTQ